MEARQSYAKITDAQKEKLLETEKGAKRLLELQENYIREIEKNAKEVRAQILDKEHIAVSWTSLIIVSAVLQIAPTFSGLENTAFLLLTAPSFTFAILYAALTLLKHPSYVQTSILVPEESDYATRSKVNDAKIGSYNTLYQFLFARYNSKTEYGSFVAPSVLVNIISNLSYLLFFSYFFTQIPQTYAIIFSGAWGILSMFAIVVLRERLRTTKTLRKEIQTPTQ